MIVTLTEKNGKMYLESDTFGTLVQNVSICSGTDGIMMLIELHPDQVEIEGDSVKSWVDQLIKELK